MATNPNLSNIQGFSVGNLSYNLPQQTTLTGVGPMSTSNVSTNTMPFNFSSQIPLQISVPSQVPSQVGSQVQIPFQLGSQPQIPYQVSSQFPTQIPPQLPQFGLQTQSSQFGSQFQVPPQSFLSQTPQLSVPQDIPTQTRLSSLGGPGIAIETQLSPEEAPVEGQEAVIQAPEQSQRPTAFVRRITTPIEQTVPPDVLAFRQLTKEEQALRITNPRDLSLMAMRCFSCGKVVEQIQIEDALIKGLTLRQAMDEQKYIRLCCRKQIQNEPAIVNLQKQIGQQNSVIDQMRNLSLETTSALLGRSRPSAFPIGPQIQGGIKIINEQPPGMSESGIGMYGLSEESQAQGGICLSGLNESFMDERLQNTDAFEYFTSQLEDVGAEEDD